MKGKVQPRDGLHINGEGAESLRDFLVKKFTSYKPEQYKVPQQPENFRCIDTSQEDVHQMVGGYERVIGHRNSRPPPTQPTTYHRAWHQHEDVQFPPLHNDDSQLVTSQRMVPSQQNDSLKDLSKALASVLYTHLYRHV